MLGLGVGVRYWGLGFDVFHTFAHDCTSTFEQVSRCCLICCADNCYCLRFADPCRCILSSLGSTERVGNGKLIWCCDGVQISSSMSKRRRGNRAPSRERRRVESPSTTLTQRTSWNVLDACAKSGRDYYAYLIRKRDSRFRAHLEQH